MNKFTSERNPMNLEGRAQIVVVKKKKFTPLVPTVIIQLGDPLNPETFIGQGWKIIAGETDERGEALTKIDFSEVKFETTLKKGEISVGGEERLKRLKKSGHIRLGGKAFKACWDNRHLFPESLKKDKNGNVWYIFFDGIVLLSPRGDRYVPCLCFRGGRWLWICRWLGGDWDANDLSAMLVS